MHHQQPHHYSKLSTLLPRAGVLSDEEEPHQEQSEPIAPTNKNILFPLKYQSPLTKIASTIEFNIPNTYSEPREFSTCLKQTADDADYCLRYDSRRGVADFAQKYLFKQNFTAEEPEESEAEQDSCSEENESDSEEQSICGETTPAGVVDEGPRVATGGDMFFSCCDWEHARDQQSPDEYPRQCRRKEKFLRK